MVGLVEIADTRKAGGDFPSVIGRSVIDEDDFVAGIIEFT